MLQLSDLKKRYDTGDYALKGVTLDVPQGQVLALIGPWEKNKDAKAKAPAKRKPGKNKSS